jgi:hypothetical protein
VRFGESEAQVVHAVMRELSLPLLAACWRMAICAAVRFGLRDGCRGVVLSRRPAIPGR